MKNFIRNNFLTPWKKSNYVGQVLWLCLPICGILSWILFALPLFKIDSLTIYGWNLFSTITIEDKSFNFFGIKEVLGCVYLMVLGIYGMFGYKRIHRVIQAVFSCLGISLFGLFPLFNVKNINTEGFTTDFKAGSVLPIIFAFIMMISTIILCCTTDKDKKE